MPCLAFKNSASHWEKRYAMGGWSGSGSYGHLAEFKAKIINEFIVSQGIQTVVELGCGDGNQLARFKVPRYLGLDVSQTAITRLSHTYASDETKTFRHIQANSSIETEGVLADLSLSLDVVYHLTEDVVFEQYMKNLFSIAGQYVIVYSSNDTRPSSVAHVRHRQFTDFVNSHFPQWKLVEVIKNPHPKESWADFFIWHKAAK